jgi:hypothetical protein
VRIKGVAKLYLLLNLYSLSRTFICLSAIPWVFRAGRIDLHQRR